MAASALVVGAGLAGLSAATAMANRGARVDLVDLASSVEGASIAVTQRAVDALAELGVLEQVMAVGTASMLPAFVRQFDEHGDPLPLPDMPPPVPRPDGLPAFVSIYRPDLWRLLEEAAVAAGVRLLRPVSVEDLTEGNGGVEVLLTNGERNVYDVVVACEGVHSGLRDRLFPAERPRYVGVMSLRCIIPGVPPGQEGFYHAPGGYTLAVTLLPGDRAYIATGEPMPLQRMGAAEGRAMVRSILERFPAPFPQVLLQHLDDAPDIIPRPFEYILLPQPVHGRVVVLGDAAHATTPHLSSGGSMALEDGVVLADELDRHESVEAALAAFADRRRDRVRLVTETSLKLMELEHAGAPAPDMARLRGRALALLGEPY